jgi:hypothetical protein
MTPAVGGPWHPGLSRIETAPRSINEGLPGTVIHGL